jgi:hypothetical protein
MQHRLHLIGLQIRAIGNTDLALDGRDAVQPLAAGLVGEHEAAEPLGGEVEGAVDAQRPARRLSRCPALGTAVPSMMRISRPSQAAGTGQHLADQPLARTR